MLLTLRKSLLCAYKIIFVIKKKDNATCVSDQSQKVSIQWKITNSRTKQNVY